nr:ARID DNA-binding domain-containing protein [Tanacetum cinerariifolium]
MGEVLIKDGSNGYLIPEVHYAPEITLNILSINLLKQQGFEIIFEGDRYTLEYMLKNQRGQNMDVDKMRQRHNDYLDDYFESLDKERADKGGEIARFVEDTNALEVHTFYEVVAFLNLIKNDDIISKGWDIYRKIFDKVLKWFYNHYLKRRLSRTISPVIHGVPIYLSDLNKLMDCMGGYLSVQFGQEFGAHAEILGLTRSDGEEIRKCYITYLYVFISYYKIARAPEDPTKVEEDSESLEPYQWNTGKTSAVEKGKEKLEHFGIKLEEEEVCNEQQSSYYEKEQSQFEREEVGRSKWSENLQTKLMEVLCRQELQWTMESVSLEEGCIAMQSQLRDWQLLAMAPEDPTKVEEDSESLEPYKWNIGKTSAVEKGKEKLENIGIKLEEEKVCNEQQSSYYEKEQSQTRVAVDNGECISRRRLCSHAVSAMTLVTPWYSALALEREILCRRLKDQDKRLSPKKHSNVK